MFVNFFLFLSDVKTGKLVHNFFMFSIYYWGKALFSITYIMWPEFNLHTISLSLVNLFVCMCSLHDHKNVYVVARIWDWWAWIPFLLRYYLHSCFLFLLFVLFFKIGCLSGLGISDYSWTNWPWSSRNLRISCPEYWDYKSHHTQLFTWGWDLKLRSYLLVS